MLEELRHVDLVVPEQSWDDKALYIDMFDVDIFAMGMTGAGSLTFLKKNFLI